MPKDPQFSSLTACNVIYQKKSCFIFISTCLGWGVFNLFRNKSFKRLGSFFNNINSFFLKLYVFYLKIKGVGFKFLINKKSIGVIKLGFSHRIVLFPIKNIKLIIIKNRIKKKFLKCFGRDHYKLKRTIYLLALLRKVNTYTKKGVYFLG